MNKFQIKEIKTKKEMIKLLPLLQQLQSKLNEEKFSSSLEIMLKNGYRMIGVFINNQCVGLTGIWINAKLYCGKYLELDNFIIDKHYRSTGIGTQLLNWIELEAKKNSCRVIMLDAYKENISAHKFYSKERFELKGFHFIKKLI